MHLDDELIQRGLHGELGASDRAALERHVADCPDCRERLLEAERDEAAIFVLLRQTDHAVPNVGGASVMARAGRARDWKRWAAVMALVILGAGAAYAVPGSPFPGWLTRMIARATPAPEARVPAASTIPVQGVTAGISVRPTAHFIIRFAANQTRGTVTVSMTDRNDVAVRVLNGTATFTTGTDRLVLENTGSVADFEIDLPRTANWIEIQLGQRPLLQKNGAKVSTSAVAHGDRYVLSLADSVK